jgi:hypothetical protein
MKRERVRFVLLSLALCICTGCFFGRPKRVGAPEWDPEKITDDCLALVDSDKNGSVSASELKLAPGLQYCAKQLDTNGDNQLSRDEILERFKLYVETKVGLKGYGCRVRLNGQPADGVEVRLVPEPFLADYIEPATGQASEGNVSITSPNPEGLPFARIGMYRVEITSPHVKIPAKFNTETTLGVEISPVTNPYLPAGGDVFDVTGR